MTLHVLSWTGPENTKRMAHVLFNGIPMDVLVQYDNRRNLSDYQNQCIEFDFGELISFELIASSCDEKSGIVQIDHDYHILGRIHNVLRCDESTYIIDLYIQSGPEFVSITRKSEITDGIGKFAKAIVRDLCCYPTFT